MYFSDDTRRAGAELWLTTTRPYLRLDNVDPDTRFWLQENNIYYDALMYDENKYEVLGDRVDPARVVAVLDDEPDQVAEAAAVFGDDVPIWRLNGYNDHGGWTGAMIESLNTACEVICDRVQQWKAAH